MILTYYPATRIFIRMEATMLDFRTETFLCAARLLNFTRAAAELNITQPAVTQHIHYLEEYYHTKLFSLRGKNCC